jgi:hypothetical protein
MLNHMQKLCTWDDEKYRNAGERREQHGRKVVEVEREVVRELNLKPITKYQEKEINKTARELRSQERLITGMERLMKRDYSTFMERFSDHYARLTGATTN